MLNNNVIALASTKEYGAENLEYFRFRSSPKTYFLVELQRAKKMKKMKKKKTKMGYFKVRPFASGTRSLAFKASL